MTDQAGRSDGALSLARAVLLAGAAAALLDFCYASVVGALHHRSPERVLQSIAGALLGKQSYSAGAASATLGAAMHLLIATCMAAVYALGRRASPRIGAHPVATGLIYGLGLYAAMYHLVLPLRWPQLFPRFAGAETLADVGIHLLVGLTIASVLAWAAPAGGADGRARPPGGPLGGLKARPRAKA